MKKFIPQSLLATACVLAATVHAQTQNATPAPTVQALAQKYACVACHQPAVKTVGPSWKDIAARYGEGKGSAAQLATSIKSGSSGKWGAMPMPAQAQVPDADLQTLAQWLVDGAK